MTDFDSKVESVWRELESLIPDDLKIHFSGIRFLIEDRPSEELLKDLGEELREAPEELCGLHVGTPMIHSSVTFPELEPVRVYLFREALIALADPEDPEFEQNLEEEIAITLLHEIGHYFGLDEEDLERLGYD